MLIHRRSIQDYNFQTMKKLLLFLSISFTISILGQGQLAIYVPEVKLKQHHLNEHELKGHVKNVSYFSFSSDKLPNVKKIDLTSETPYSKVDFNPTGYLTASYCLDSLGKLNSIPCEVYKYDEKGYIIESKVLEMDGSTTIHTYEFNNDYCLHTVRNSPDDSSQYREKIYFLKDENIDKTINENGTVTSDNEFKKNSNGQITEIVQTLSNESKLIYRYEYNSKGQISKLDISENKNNYTTFTYDNKGKLIKECYFAPCMWSNDAKIVLTGATYWTYNMNGQITSIFGKKENGNCNPLPPHPAYSYEYEYDSQGNWVKKSEYHDKILVSITVRQITYY